MPEVAWKRFAWISLNVRWIGSADASVGSAVFSSRDKPVVGRVLNDVVEESVGIKIKAVDVCFGRTVSFQSVVCRK